MAGARLEAQAPRLAEQFRAELVVGFGLDDLETDGIVYAPSGGQDAMRPQRYFAVANPSRKTHAFLDQPAADAEAACPRIDDQQAQLADSLALLDQEHR